MASEDKYPDPEMPMYNQTLASMSPHNMSGLMASAGSVVDHRPTVSEQLAMRKKLLEAELAQVNAAIEAALREPGTMAVLDNLAKTGIR